MGWLGGGVVEIMYDVWLGSGGECWGRDEIMAGGVIGLGEVGGGGGGRDGVAEYVSVGFC